MSKRRIEMTQNIMHELKVITYSNKDTDYPINTAERKLGLYSSWSEAEAQILPVIAPEKTTKGNEVVTSARVHHFIIQELGPDSSYDDSFYYRRVYDDAGSLYGVCKPDLDPFFGIKQEDCRFREEDIVEVAVRGQLRVGIITLQPLNSEYIVRVNKKLKDSHFYFDQTDNTYNVDFGYLERDHEHLPECDIFKPKFAINRATRTYLLKAYKWLRK